MPDVFGPILGLNYKGSLRMAASFSGVNCLHFRHIDMLICITFIMYHDVPAMKMLVNEL